MPDAMARTAMERASSAPNTPTALTTSPALPLASPAAASNSARARSAVTVRDPPAKIAPTYAAPSRAACRASSARVSPQNLTLATFSSGHTDECRDGRTPVRRGGQQGPHEHRVRAERGGPLDIGAAGHAALVHRRAIGGHERQQAGADRIVHSERLEIPVVDADDGMLDLEGMLELPFIAHLEQHVEAKCARLDVLLEVRDERELEH